MTIERTLGLLFGAVFLCSAAPSRAVEPGPEIYKKLECQKCHSIESEGIEKVEEEKSALDMFAEEEEEEAPDLSGIGAEHDAEWLMKWIRKEVRNDDGKKHKQKFKGSDEELEAVVRYISGLKEKK